MKRTIKYILFSILALVLLAGAAVALAAPGDRGGPDGPGGMQRRQPAEQRQGGSG